MADAPTPDLSLADRLDDWADWDPAAARPAAGSSSPDVTALTERLRDWPYGRPAFVRSEAEQAADALEAQAARITELEAAIRAHRESWLAAPAPGLSGTPNLDLWALLDLDEEAPPDG